MITRNEPTHKLTITIPLAMTDDTQARSPVLQHAFKQVIDVIMPIIKLGTLGILCDDPQVDLVPTLRDQK